MARSRRPTRTGGPAAGAATEPGPDRAAQLVRAVSGIASALALLTALLYYFGWVRSEYQARAFGADASVFGMSSQELVIRSADVLFVPLLASALAVIAGLAGHQRLLRLGHDPLRRPAVERIATVLRWTWVPALGVSVLGLATDPPVGTLALPFLFAAGVGTAWYAHELRQRITDGSRPTPTAVFLALAAVMAISVFWMAERVARIGAEARVEAIQTDVAGALGAATLYTDARLQLSGPGLRETVLGSTDHPVYRYDGLYLLQRSGGAYFFLTDRWDVGGGRLVVLPEGQVARLDFGPGR